MPINAAFLAARAAERRHRHLIHVRALCWIPLRRRGVVFTRSPLVPLTERHCLDLTLAGNALFVAQPVLLGDVFLFLWRLHPRHRAIQPGREPLVANLDRCGRFSRFARLWFALGSLPAACLHRRLTRCVRESDLAAVTAAVFAFRAAAEQDATGEEISRGHRSVSAPERCAADNVIDYLMSAYRLSHDEALDFPIALGHQLYRDRQFSMPEGELNVFNDSDRLLSV